MKKILYVITKSNWGGAQRYVYDLATSLSKEDYESTVVAGGNGLLKDKLESAGIPTINLESMIRNVDIKKEFKSAIELYKIFRSQKPDIVHLNSSKAGGIGALVARIARVPHIIFTAHAWAFNENRSIASKMLIGFIHWTTVILSHRTIAVSYAVKEQVSHMPFIKNKIHVIYPGINSFEVLNKQEARSKLSAESIESEEIWIGTISELHPVKGIPFEIDALNLLKEKYPNLKLHIIGEGESRALIEKQIAKRKLESKVYLNGFIDDAKSYLKAFDIFILPSLSESFGYSIAEAGLVGIPVIASKVGGIPELVDEFALLVPSKDCKAISDAITLLIENKEKAQTLINGLSNRIKEDFNTNLMLKNTIDIYNL